MVDQSTTPPASPSCIHINVDLVGALGEFERHLIEIQEATLLSLVALEQLPRDVEVSKIPGADMGSFIGNAPTSDTASIDRSSTWIAGAALRQATDVFGMLCESVWKFVKIAEAADGRPVRLDASFLRRPTLSGLADAVVGKTASIDRPGTSDKLDLLKKLGIETAWEAEVKSMHAVRNCITHRHGVVGDADLKLETTLVLRYRHNELLVVTPSGKSFPLKPGITIEEAGSSLHLVPGREGAKTFSKGDRIVISNQELVHVLTTIHGAGRQLVACARTACEPILDARAEAMASPPRSPSAPAQSASPGPSAPPPG